MKSFYDDKNAKTGKFEYQELYGTATLYHKINNVTFVIITAAHNFVQFEEQKEGSAEPIFAKETYFYLQRNGEDFVFEFKVKKHYIYPKYLES